METKTLRLEGVPGKVENEYVMAVPVPGKLELLNMIEKPPFHIFSKEDTTFSTGILAFVPHSLKVRISRDYQEPFVGLYIRITPKSDVIIDIADVRGTFTINPPDETERAKNPFFTSSKTNSSQRSHPFHGVQSYHAGDSLTITNNNHTSLANNNNSISSGNSSVDCSQVVSFNFFKNSVSKLLDLENYDYYESRCQWPDVASELKLYIKVSKTTYSVLVSDDSSCSYESLEAPKDSIPSSPYFLSETFSDVAIHVGETIFPAHKMILSERSRYFARMFANSMRETNEGVVRIADEDESLFREILRFIYEGKIENLEENASELFILSDKYDIPDLAVFCEKYLLKKLTVDNSMEMFDLSQSILVQGLLAKKSKELIMWNREKFASDLQTFKDFSRKYPEIIFELLQLN